MSGDTQGADTAVVLVGDRIGAIVGAAADGRFYSLDIQAGRPALLVSLGGLDAEGVRALLQRLIAAEPQVRAAGGDIVPIAPVSAPFAAALSGDEAAAGRIIYAAVSGGLDRLQIDGAPAAVVLDRSGRVIDLQPVRADTDLAALFAAAVAHAPREPGRLCATSAPVLIIPNVAPPAFCRAVIDYFEASPHAQGVMASYVDGEAQARTDLGKKHRRDTELVAGTPLHDAVMELIAARIAPEIKRAFQKDITFADRILIARYDDDGGYFRRHRDDASPQVAFRQFALSLNLNTEEYDGGELLFPEFNDHRFSPPAGSAILFSASLLHEASPVTRGSRYVLLSFLCGETATAQAG